MPVIANTAPLTLASSLLLGVATALVAAWLGPSWDAYTRGYIADLAPRLDALGIATESRSAALRWWGVALFVASVGFGVILAMPPVAVGVTYLVYIAPRMILDRLIDARRAKLRDQMVRAATGLANTARAGLSLSQGLEEVASTTPPPLRREFQTIVREIKSGARLEASLRRVEQSLEIEAFTVFTSAILTCLERGGNLSYALERISTGLQEMQRLERKLEADSAAGRQLATVLAVFPFFFLGMFAVLDPYSTSFMFSTLAGQFVLLAVGAVVYLAIRWCMVILDIDF